MTDEAALLAAVLADPADDDPRLRYADWLDEADHGDRAEWIRVQCAQAMHEAAAERCPSDPFRDDLFSLGYLPRSERMVLERREATLFGLIYRELDFGVPPGSPVSPVVRSVLHAGGMGYRFRRGFVESVTCTAADWLKYRDVVLACQPVTQVVLAGGVTAVVLEELARIWPKVKFLMSGYDFFAAAQAAHPVPWRGAV